ncbi:hypothetical protein G9A89_018386 [Geosiphon pyriformis]|nr:hypothetical protein G9A89_018386 [Geosiphon pyriformis]
MAEFMNKQVSLRIKSADSLRLPVLSVLDSEIFSGIRDSLIEVWSNSIKVYTNGSLKSAGSAKVVNNMAAYFLAINMSVRVRVYGLLFSILTELQAIVLALECVLSSCAVVLYSNSQFAIGVCMSETSFIVFDFHNQCWIKRSHIVDLIRNKDILVK